MKHDDSALEGPGARTGTAMTMSWFLFLGVLGFGLLCGVAYAMATQNLALGIFCGLLCFAPLMLTVVWGGAHLFGLLRQRKAKDLAPEPEPLAQSVQED